MNLPAITANERVRTATRLPRWAWRLPWAAAFLLPFVIAALMWLLYANEREEQRLALISDALWIEQYLRFHVDRQVEQLGVLAADVFENEFDAHTATTRARTLVEQGDGLVRIAWLTKEARLLEGVPASNQSHQRQPMTEPQLDAFRSAARLGKPVYSLPYDIRRNDARFDVYVPHYRNQQLAGMTMAVYSTGALLNRMVPWWFTERYRITLVDENGAVLSANSAVMTDESRLSYQLAFEPLGSGAMLVVTAHRTNTRLVPIILMIAIVLLAAAILFSLLAMRRHMRRRLRAEQAAREEYAFRKAMEDSLLTGLCARDLQGRIIYVNPAFCRMVGWNAEELIGRAPPMPYWASEQSDETVAVKERARTGAEPHEAVEMRFRRKSGESFDALIYEAPLIDADGQQHGWMGSVLDITARKRAEALYRQQQEKFQFTARLVTMGEMASVLAHELNQPLSAISSYTTGSLNVLERTHAPRTEVIETLHKVVIQARRAGEVIRRVHEFVRRREPCQEVCRIEAIVEDAIGLIEPAARHRGVHVQAEISAPLPMLYVDRVMIEQLLLNLMRNGMDAMSDLDIEQRVLRVRVTPDEGGVRITVADSGSGIAPEVATRLYEPFYSTKQDGMGMGLNICRSITELHHGRLWFEPRAAGGTEFHCWLPHAA